jgi:hypothetical protein
MSKSRNSSTASSKSKQAAAAYDALLKKQERITALLAKKRPERIKALLAEIPSADYFDALAEKFGDLAENCKEAIKTQADERVALAYHALGRNFGSIADSLNEIVEEQGEVAE